VNRLLHAPIWMLLDFAVRCPAEADGYRNPQFTAAGLLVNGFDRALSNQGGLKFAHCALQAEQAVVNQVWIIDAVQIHQDSANHPAQLDESVPVSTITG
jgi:hypothetical protein